MWERKELKRRGLAAFKANYWKCVLIGILLTLFVAGSSVTVSRTGRSGMSQANVNSGVTVVSDGAGTTYVMSNETASQIENAITEAEITMAMQDPTFRMMVREILTKIGALLATVLAICILLRELVFNPIEVGCRGFFTSNCEAPASPDEVRRGFHPYGRTVGTMLLRDLFLFLWGMLFVIPGVIKRYSYRMVPYILADDPTISGMDAINLSREMMNGHKWNTFVLDLSFIGWDILTVLTAGLVGMFYANPYQFSTGAELYRVLKEQ